MIEDAPLMVAGTTPGESKSEEAEPAKEPTLAASEIPAEQTPAAGSQFPRQEEDNMTNYQKKMPLPPRIVRPIFGDYVSLNTSTGNPIAKWIEEGVRVEDNGLKRDLGLLVKLAEPQSLLTTLLYSQFDIACPQSFWNAVLENERALAR